MSASWSAHRRRAAWLALAIAGGAALLPALSWLEQVRSRGDALSALVQAPLPKVAVAPPGIVFHGDRHAAEASLSATVRDAATRERTLIERIEARSPPAPGVSATHVVLSGEPAAMLRVIEAIESRTPVVRLASYRLARNASGLSLRLETDLVMAFAP